MVFQLNDFTDSESEPDDELDNHGSSSSRNGGIKASSNAARGGGGRDITPHSPAAAAAISPRAGVSPRSFIQGPSVSTSSAHPLRITLRPNLSHLTDPSPRPSAAGERSSLSPPPPITLKLSRQARAEKATYSSSEGEDSRPDPTEEGLGDMEVEDEVEMDGSGAYGSHAKPGSKKKGAKRMKLGHGSSKTGHSSPIPGPSTTPTIIPPGGPTIKLPAQHRKTYDWLTPSAVSASHSGPPQRDEKGNVIPPSAELPLMPKKSSKRKSEPGSGPGRNWRKGLKKGAKPEYQDQLQDISPYEAQPVSLEASPEPQEYPPRPELLPRAYSSNRGNTPPFDPADPVKLGFPVYTKPITNPKFTLGVFPRITQFFAPQNGGDTGPFPRKEPVRLWKNQEMTLVGIGGGTLRYKSWSRGPATELTRLIQVDREARDSQRAAKKANTAATASASAAAAIISASTTPAPSGPDTLIPSWDQPTSSSRPQLNSTNSTDSVIPQLQSTQGDDEASEVGDGEESVILQSSTISAGPQGTGLGPKGAKKKPAQRPSRAKPRKSKLAQEIMPVEAVE